MVDRLRNLRPIDVSGEATRAFDPYVVDIIDIIGTGRPRLPSRLAIRPHDLVVLEVSWSGLDLEEQGEPVLTRSKNGNGHLILTFAPQNLAEKAFFQASEFPQDPGDPWTTPSPGVPDNAPIDHLLSDNSRLVFRVPKGTTVPLNIEDVLEAAGRLELSAPANALPRERRINLVLVAASDLLAEAVAIRGSQNAIERLVTSGRLRERVRGSGPLVAESVPALEAVIAPHLRVTPEIRASVTVRGELVSEAHRSEIATVITEMIRLRPTPAPPSATQTAIESPYRLLISPSKLGGWAHSSGVVERNGRTELWHTRLGVRAEDAGGQPVIDEYSAFQRVVRAVWARGLPHPSKYNEGPGPYKESDGPFRMSLDERDRHNIVHLSSNFGITQGGKRYTPEPVVVNRLMLTSLGSWMDFEGEWDPWPQKLLVQQWLHRATVGRDHYVRVVYKGFIVPFGHRVTLVKETERKFASDQPDRDWGKSDNPAYLIQRMFIVVEEQEKTFGGSKTFGGGKKFSNAMPFKAVRILDRQTPDLDLPDQSQFDSKGPAGFWPMVGKKPFLFRMVATDGEGNQVTFAAPLLFVDKTIDDDKAGLEGALKAYSDGTGITGDPASVMFRGQRVAYAPAKGVDDTTFETESITFAAAIPAQPPYTLSTPGPRFLPQVAETKLLVPAIRQIVGSNQPLTVTFDDTFLQHGFTTAASNPNKGELLFRTPELKEVALALERKSDRSGGLAAPSMKISGISRSLGAVAGEADKILQGEFDPAEFFKGMTALLFGVIPLSEVIGKVDFPSALEKVPRFVGKTLDQVEAFLDDLARLEQLLKGHAALWDQVKAEVAKVATEIQKLFKATPADLTTALGELEGKVALLKGQLPGPLPVAAANEVKAMLARVDKALDDIDDLVGLVEKLVNGIEIPRSMSSRFEWKPDVKPWPASDPIFDPSGSLVLVVEARGSVDQGGDFTVSASLEDFWLRMLGSARFLSIHFVRIQLQVEAGKKPEIDVVMGDIVFEGVLAFVETLRNLIPLDAFSDPPAVQVDSTGIKAELTVGLPNVSVGVFSLENLSLGGGFAVPFVGDPLSVYFRFCERENPALVSVSLFAGGFYFGITLNPEGVRILEAAIEFGANVSMNFGVASGGVSAMAGLYFKLELSDATLTGYFRVRGNVRALGIVSVSIELYLEMSYETATGKCVGRAKLTISISLFLFEATITISCEKKFAGSGADPTFLQAMGPYQLDPSDPTSPIVDPWEEYCAAFA